MNSQYLIPMFLLIITSIVFIAIGGLSYSRHIVEALLTIIVSVLGVAMLTLSFLVGGKSTSVTKPATVTHVGDLLVVHSEEIGTLTTDNIKYLDKNVTLTRRTSKSAWGYEVNYQLSVNVVPPTPKDTSPRINETSMRQQLREQLELEKSE